MLAGLLVSIALLVALGALLGSAYVAMPGKSHRGPLPPLTEAQRTLAAELRREVEKLAGEIGERNVRRPQALEAARAFVRGEFERCGLAVEDQTWREGEIECANVIAELRGGLDSAHIVVVGAHYDSVTLCPGANDNGSGVAALLAIARALSHSSPRRTLRFVAFANEEPPYFGSDDMGSAHYAARCAERREEVVAMLSLETIGYYTDAPKSQTFPAPGLGLVFPTTGNFLSFVGDRRARALVREAVRIFREHAAFPSEGAALPAWIPGVDWSDQRSFWKHGYPALMATDTAPFRYPHYHTGEDTPDKLDYERFARAVEGLTRVVEAWSNAE